MTARCPAKHECPNYDDAGFAVLVVEAHQRGLAEGRAERANSINVLTRGAYADGLGDARREATEGAADRAEAAMRAESDRLAAPGTARAVEQGIGVAHAISAVRRAIVGPWEPAEQPEPATVNPELTVPPVKILSYHYGPTAQDPDPGAMWCYGCGGRVDLFGGHALCGCGAQLCESLDDCGDDACPWRPAHGGTVATREPVMDLTPDPGLHAHEGGVRYRDCSACAAKAGRIHVQHDPGALMEEPDLYEQGEGGAR